MDTNAPLIFSLDADRGFAETVAAQLGVSLAVHEEREFDDGEHKIRPLENVRNRDLYLVQSLYSDDRHNVNDRLIRLLFFIGALRDASAARITAVIPYLCYARKDRRAQPRDPIASRYLSQLLEAMGVDRVVTLDVHNESAFQNSLRCPAETLHARHLFMAHFAQRLPASALCVASPDIGGVKRAEAFRERFSRFLGVDISTAYLEKKRSNGKVGGPATVAGEVEDRDVIVFDDMIASGTTLARAAAAFLGQGARSVHGAATHGVFTGDSDAILATENLSSITITNSLPPWRLSGDRVWEKLTVIDAAPLVAEAIKRMHEGGSVVELMEG